MRPTAPACLRVAGDACELLLHAVPGASRSEVAGEHDGALRVRLAAPPVEGRANAELLRWLAGELGLPRRAVTLVSGVASRRKRVLIEAPAALVTAWLERRLAAPPS